MSTADGEGQDRRALAPGAPAVGTARVHLAGAEQPLAGVVTVAFDNGDQVEIMCGPQHTGAVVVVSTSLPPYDSSQDQAGRAAELRLGVPPTRARPSRTERKNTGEPRASDDAI